MKKLISGLGILNQNWIITSSIFLVLIMGTIDYITGIEISFSIFYFLPIAISAWFTDKNKSIMLASFCGFVWLSADLLSGHQYSSEMIIVWNTIMRLTIFIIIAVLISELKKYQNLIYNKELKIEKERHIIQTSQRIVGLIANNITIQNAEILKWINKRKVSGSMVSMTVEKASNIIGKSINILTEVSFMYGYSNKEEIELDKYIDHIKNKLEYVKEIELKQ